MKVHCPSMRSCYPFPRLEFSPLDILPRIPFESVPQLIQNGSQVLPYLTTVYLELQVLAFLAVFFVMGTRLLGIIREKRKNLRKREGGRAGGRVCDLSLQPWEGSRN